MLRLRRLRKLTDHYDPRSKTLRLSEPVYGGRSMAAFGVAAHEVGHAVQHAHGYAPLKFRSAWVPAAATGNRLSMIAIIISLVMGGAASTAGLWAAWVGVGLLGLVVVMTLVTLPVEFDASRRAKRFLDEAGIVSPREAKGVDSVLDAAALTYVAAAAAAVLQMLYWVSLIAGRRD